MSVRCQWPGVVLTQERGSVFVARGVRDASSGHPPPHRLSSRSCYLAHTRSVRSATPVWQPRKYLLSGRKNQGLSKRNGRGEGCLRQRKHSGRVGKCFPTLKRAESATRWRRLSASAFGAPMRRRCRSMCDAAKAQRHGSGIFPYPWRSVSSGVTTRSEWWRAFTAFAVPRGSLFVPRSVPFPVLFHTRPQRSTRPG